VVVAAPSGAGTDAGEYGTPVRHPITPSSPPPPPVPVTIDLRTPVSLRTAFAFPLQSPEARREVVRGAVLLLVPPVGWVLNMGHRIVLVHRMLHGEPPWPAWRGYGELLKHGLITLGGMIYYNLPAALVGYLAWRSASLPLAAAAGVLFALAALAIPGYMTHYCVRFDPREIYSPARALRRALEGGRAYWRAWGDRARGAGSLLHGAAGAGRGVPGHQRLVLAGSRLRLRPRLRAEALHPPRYAIRRGGTEMGRRRGRPLTDHRLRAPEAAPGPRRRTSRLSSGLHSLQGRRTSWVSSRGFKRPGTPGAGAGGDRSRR
jgi:uncharacterized protein DUF4013